MLICQAKIISMKAGCIKVYEQVVTMTSSSSMIISAYNKYMEKFKILQAIGII